jgi:hypothetical protein
MIFSLTNGAETVRSRREKNMERTESALTQRKADLVQVLDSVG